MMFRIGFIGLCALVMCGCLTTERTPYNEVDFLAETSSEQMVNAWPFYNGNGVVNYVAWPFIKWSPGCFAALPFYNYDHGIHDFCLLGTAVPEKGEYRLWPIFYRSPECLYLFPGGYWKHGVWLAPLFLWERDGEDTMFLSPLYSQFRDYYTIGNKRWRDIAHIAPLGLAGYTYGEKQLPSQTQWETDETFGWVFPLYWRGRYEEDAWSLLFPLYYTQTYEKGNFLATPLVGWGRNADGWENNFWYALNCGAYHAKSKGGTQSYWWCLPFYFYRDVMDKELLKRWRVTSHWTLLSYAEWRVTPYKSIYPTTEWHIGPFGLPLLADIERSPHREQTYIFPFNRTTVWRTTSEGEIKRYAVNSVNQRGLGGWLYDWKRDYRLVGTEHPQEVLKEDDRCDGYDFSLLAGLVGYKNRYKETELTASRRQFGWFLWDSKTEHRWWMDNKKQRHDKIMTSLFTPMVSWKHTIWDGELTAYSRGVLLNAVEWGRKEETFNFDLLWSVLWHGRYEENGSRYQCLLTPFVFDQNITAPKEERMTHWCAKRCWKACEHPPVKTTRQRNGERIDTHLLCGLLYMRDKYDAQTWEYAYGSECPEKPKVDDYRDELAVLTPLVYSAEAERDGSFKRRTLRGLFHDHTYDAEKAVETFGILGFLYRYNGYKDGTHERTLFPFIKVASNAEQETWSFSFLHKLFRIEHTPEGNHYTFFGYKQGVRDG